jgi:hypothetical protein
VPAEPGAGDGPARPPAPNEGTVSVAAQLAAVALLVLLGYFFKSFFLNWFVGPLFVLFVLVVVPRSFQWARSRWFGAAAP